MHATHGENIIITMKRYRGVCIKLFPIKKVSPKTEGCVHLLIIILQS